MFATKESSFVYSQSFDCIVRPIQFYIKKKEKMNQQSKPLARKRSVMFDCCWLISIPFWIKLGTFFLYSTHGARAQFNAHTHTHTHTD